MILSCPKCSTRLQLETAKLPTRTFTIKCPKCQNVISVPLPNLGIEESSAPEQTVTARPAHASPAAAVPPSPPPFAEGMSPKLAAEAMAYAGAG